jgi:predicted outer membrane repeat protein
VITFSCGGPATIPITVEHALSLTADTTIDGAGQITLEGQHTVRLLGFHSANFRATHTVVTLQGLTLKGGRATGTALPAAPAPCSQGYDLDGSGGALFMRDGILHVIDSTFVDNEAASPGPDVAGGAIYVVGSLEATIVGSTFTGNRASNGGAVGSLFSNLTLVNDAFTGNQATGTGANSIDPSCHVNGGESGDGGNGGAVVMDGGEDFAVLICGCRFTSNTAGAFGGGVFRTPDIGRQTTTLDRTVFDQNRAKGAGAAYFHHTDLTVTATTFSANQAEGGGALQADDTVLTATNSTWAGNVATHGLGGAVALFGNGGALAYCTFVGNTSPGGSGLFGAALAGGTALTITGTLFAANTDQDCGAPMACQDGTSPGADNLQWPATHAVCSNADPACAAGTTFADPMLGALGDHGGPTPTAAPGPGSPARGAGHGCPATDQRGQPRLATGCTLGAVE